MFKHICIFSTLSSILLFDPSSLVCGAMHPLQEFKKEDNVPQYISQVMVGFHNTEDVDEVYGNKNLLAELQGLMLNARKMIGYEPDAFLNIFKGVKISAHNESHTLILTGWAEDPVVASSFMNTWAGLVIGRLHDKYGYNCYIKVPGQIPIRPSDPYVKGRGK